MFLELYYRRGWTDERDASEQNWIPLAKVYREEVTGKAHMEIHYEAPSFLIQKPDRPGSFLGGGTDAPGRGEGAAASGTWDAAKDSKPRRAGGTVVPSTRPQPRPYTCQTRNPPWISAHAFALKLFFIF